MNPQLVQLFRDVLDVATEERSVFLDANCQDADLRAQIEAFLAASLNTAQPFFVPAQALDLMAVTDENQHRPLDRSGQIVGPYRLTTLLGSGGMGAVWKAERVGGFAQTVAIKWAHAAGLSAATLTRFAIERQVLAKLDHPGIARILDGGSDAGALWFAMEYVDGLPLDRYVDAVKPSLAARLKLVIELCASVHYAHQNLIVHRDLKPSNIMVLKDGSPKLLDFGIAKQLDQLDELTHSRAPMSFAYAAPEQIRGDAITTATDLYALGVILFELLTGERPHKIKGDGSLSLLQAITDTDASAPSLALQRTTSTKSSFSVNQLKGDLDTITLKTLSRDPARRYASAQALAEDIQRNLEGLPISARKDSGMYRALKLVRRNPAASIAIGLAMLAMLAGTTVAVIQRQQALNQRALAEQNAEKARATKDFVLRVFTGANRWNTGRDVSALELAYRGFLEVETQLKGQPEAQFELYSTLAAVFGRNSPQSRTVAASEKRLALVEQLPNASLTMRFQVEADHLSYLWWAERLDAVRTQIDRIHQRYPQQLAADANLSAGVAEVELLLLAAKQDYPAFRKATAPEVLRLSLAQNHVVESYLAHADGVETRVADGITRLKRLTEFARTDLEANSPVRGWLAATVTTLLAEHAPSTTTQALAARGMRWCEAFFGANSSYCDRLTQMHLRASVRQGRWIAAEAYFQRSFAVNNRFPNEAIIELQPLLYQGALAALGAGNRALAATRAAQALNLGKKLSGEFGSCVRSATALKLLLTGTPQALRELRSLSELQWQNVDAESWRSQMWLASDALERKDFAAAKADLARIAAWFHARGARLDTSLPSLLERAGLSIPAAPQIDVSELVQINQDLLLDAESMQQQRARLAPVSSADANLVD